METGALQPGARSARPPGEDRSGAATLPSTHRRGPRHRLDREVVRRGLLGRPPGPIVTEDDLAALPEAAQSHLWWAGVVGRPRERAFRVRFRGRIRRGPDAPWMPLDAWQVNTVAPVARIDEMRIDAAGIVPMVGADVYGEGHARMRGRVLGLVTVVEGEGPELDRSELVTWLDDAVLLAPAMLLDPAVTWADAGDDAYTVTVVDGDNRVAATVAVGDDGRVTDVRTDDRWYSGTEPPTRTPWHTPVEEWLVGPDGRPFPARCTAVWTFPEDEVTYVDGAFDPDSFVRDPPAG